MTVKIGGVGIGDERGVEPPPLAAGLLWTHASPCCADNHFGQIRNVNYVNFSKFCYVTFEIHFVRDFEENCSR